MKKLNKWVDVRKKQVREVTDMDITIKKLDWTENKIPNL